LFWSTVGSIAKNLELAGYQLANVKTVLLTHYIQTMFVVLLKMEKPYFLMQRFMLMNVKQIIG
jgi:hypothetical protein